MKTDQIQVMHLGSLGLCFALLPVNSSCNIQFANFDFWLWWLTFFSSWHMLKVNPFIYQQIVYTSIQITLLAATLRFIYDVTYVTT